LIEDIIYSLVHEIDLPQTNLLIEKYKRENNELIGRNQLRANQKLREEFHAIKDEEFSRMKRNMEYHVRNSLLSLYLFDV
jgi:hypothetical protein